MTLLRECQQGIELRQIRRFHDDLRRGRKFLTRLRQCNHGARRQRTVAGQQHTQRVVNRRFAVVRCVVQDLQILPGAMTLVTGGAEPVIGDAEPRRREEIIAIGVLGKGARFANQRIDHMPVVHGVLIAAHQPRQRVHAPIRVPDLNTLGIEPRLDLLADQPAVHGVDIPVNVNQAAAVHAARHLQTRRQPRVGQVPQHRQLLGEAILAASVPHLHEVVQEVRILVPAGKLPAAAKQQGLIDDRLEVAMRRLRVAVLVRLPRVDPLRRHPVVRHQIAITRLELPRHRKIVHGGAERVTPVPPRHAAQFPQRILQAVRQRLERLRRAHRHRFPVRVGQHEVVHQVVEPLTGDRDVQRVHVREVRRGQVAGLVHLAEHDRFARTVEGPPLPHPTFKGAAMRIEEPARMLAPQPVEEGLGQQPRLGLQPLLDRRPHLGKRIGPSAVGPRQTRLLPRAGKRAVLAVLTGRLVAHACSPGRRGQGCS